jgi:hypothetical protein
MALAIIPRARTQSNVLPVKLIGFDAKNLASTLIPFERITPHCPGVYPIMGLFARANCSK